MYCRRVYFARPGFDLGRNDVVLDLGANAGLFTTMAAVYADKVVAVEAQSEFIPIIAENLRRNGCEYRAKIEHAMVGSGTGVLSTKAAQLGASHWVRDPHYRSVIDIMESNALDFVDFLKVDVEGSEFDIFSGDLSWLRRVKRIVMEVHTEFGDALTLSNLIRHEGFVVELVDGDTGLPTETLEGPAGYLYACREPRLLAAG